MLKTKIVTIMTIGVISLSGCTNDNTNSETTIATNNTEIQNETITFGSEITSNSDSVTITDNQATITEGGVYEITGKSEDSNLVVKVPDTESVELILNGLELSSSTTAPIYVETGDEVTLTLMEGTINYLEDSTVNEELQAPLSIDETKTTIEGTGTLNIISNSQEGIECNNDLIINDGIINIQAQDDGINAGDRLEINGGTITTVSNGDGLDSNGDLVITGGTMYVSAGSNAEGIVDFGQDSVEDDSVFEITGGTLFGFGGTMVSEPTVNSTQNTFGTTINGDEGYYTITDSTGNEIVSYESPANVNYIMVTSPDLVVGETYSVNFVGEVLKTVELTDTYTSDVQSGGGVPRGGFGI